MPLCSQTYFWLENKGAFYQSKDIFFTLSILRLVTGYGVVMELRQNK